MQSKKISFQTGALIYFFLNTVFLLPIVYIDRFVHSVTFGGFGVYFAAVCFYYVFLLPYLHILFCAGFLIYSIKQFAEHKKRAVLVGSLILIAADLFVNLYWAACGRPWTIQ